MYKERSCSDEEIQLLEEMIEEHKQRERGEHPTQKPANERRRKIL